MKCKNCKYFTEIGDLCDEVLDTIEPGEIDCWGYEAATNADRIRKMSDEELASALYDMQKRMCRRFAEIVGFGETLDFRGDAPDILKWLQQPVEEDT